MRLILTVAAAIAGGALALTPAGAAEPTYQPGGALQQGHMCSVSTDGGEGFYGYMTECPQPVSTVVKHSKKHKS